MQIGLLIGEVAAVFVDDAWLAAFLPPLLRRHVEAEPTWTQADQVAACLGALDLGAVIVAWAALWRGWRSGRAWYTGSQAFAVLGFAWMPSVQFGISSVLASLGTLTTGMILGLLFFSDLRHRFARLPADSAAA